MSLKVPVSGGADLFWRFTQHPLDILAWLEMRFTRYQGAEGKLEYLQTLPWICPITKYHLTINLGLDICKPGRHLVRVAGNYDMTPEELCEKLSKEAGDHVAMVDNIIWRAANLGFI